MSYINIPRLAFSGNFQADVSTVNNDVRHYDNATFLPRFQDVQNRTEQNGWYNPDGTGNFRLFGLQVKQALSTFGTDPKNDPATGLFVNAQSKRSSCKIVDLDPQMQVVSTLFGLRIVVSDGTNEYLSGDYTASPFRDMANGRRSPLSALYTSVLSNLEWSDIAQTSPTLVALKAAADQNQGYLSINLTPYAYGQHQEGPLVGSIGAYQAGDPKTFVAGRALVNSNGSALPLGNMMADVSGGVLSFDFSNSINLDSNHSVVPIGKLHGAILRIKDTITGIGTNSSTITAGSAAGTTISAADIKLLDSIDYQDPGFLSNHAALADCTLDAEALALINDHPVAIVNEVSADQYEIVIRETNGGLYARADNFVQRMDPPVTGLVHEQIRFKVSQWGQPVANVKVVTTPLDQTVSNTYWGSGPEGPNAPKAPYPKINTPADAVDISTDVDSGADGWAVCPVTVSNPGNPRGYVDGQIYTATYQIAVGNASPQAHFDLIVIHAREAQVYPDPPSWDDIAPFMQQYDNLYPIMSRHLFRLSDPAIFKKHATLLTLAFSRPLDDPNHMPATRDLSSSKRQAVLNWLAQYTGHASPLMIASTPAQAPMAVIHNDTSNLPGPQTESSKGLESLLASVDNDTMGKNPVLRSYLSAEIARLEKGVKS